MELIKELDQFDGKRNTALTFIIPPNYEFKKDLDKIKKLQSSLKHDNKRRQLGWVMKEIDKHIAETKSYPRGHIICCGLDKSNNPIYYELSTDNAPSEFEYHYGYKFETNRVKELVFKSSVVHAEDKIAAEIRDRINTALENGVLVLKPELLIAFENHLIKDVVFLSRNQLPWELLKRSVEDGFTIYMMNMDDIRNVDIVEKYGEIIGLMHYKFDIHDLKKKD